MSTEFKLESLDEAYCYLQPKSKLVVHCKKHKYDVYIGRPSKWGNPFELGRDGDRDCVIRKYHEWIITQPDLMEALPEIRGKILGCWCSPKPCHGDVLAFLAEQSICDFRYLTDGDTIQVGDQWSSDNGITWETYRPKDNSIGENWQTGFSYNPMLFYPFRRQITRPASNTPPSS